MTRYIKNTRCLKNLCNLTGYLETISCYNNLFFNYGHYFTILSFDRCLATQAAVKIKEEPPKRENVAAKESQSFTMNLFRGQLQLNQVCPFPEPMNQEQTETIKMLVDPVEKFYEVKYCSFKKYDN